MSAVAGPLPSPRSAGRIFVLDADDRLLLVHERRDLDSDRSIWLTPGGGVEPGESLAAAAEREVYEETGLRITLDPDAQPRYVERVVFTIAGQTYDQTNHYFLARVPNGLVVSPAGHTEIERQVVLGHRWWTLAELAAAPDDREPLTMVDVVTRLLAGGEK